MILNKDKFVRIKNANIILLHDLKAKFPQFSIQLLANTIIENGVKSTLETGHLVFKQENAGSKKADDQPVKKSKKTPSEIEKDKSIVSKIFVEGTADGVINWYAEYIKNNDQESAKEIAGHISYNMGIKV